MLAKGTLRLCKNGHRYYKSSDCPVCPICEKERKSERGFLSLLSAPARRALKNAGIHTLAKLSKHTEEQILSLHGMGPKAMPLLHKELAAQKLSFKKK